MIEIVLGIVVVLAYMKLNEMNDRLIFMGKKIENLQYSLNDIQFGGNSPKPKADEKQEFQQAHSSVKPKPLHTNTPIQRMDLPKRAGNTKTEGLSKKVQKQFGSKSMEDFLVGNLLLNISIVAFVLGVGFFLKYSIDQNWIPIWGRIFIGIAIAIGMIVGAINIREKHPKLFSEVLFGGAIAILYLSIYAGFALEGFKFLSFQISFISMIAITILAGVISLRFDSLPTAVFGLVGGFATPFLINNGAENIEALMIYILILNLGVFYISFSKRWSLLNILAFILTYIIEFGTVKFSHEHFSFLLLIYFVIFVIYSIVPFIHEIRKKDIKLDTTLTVLFGANIVLYLLVTAKLFLDYGYEFKYFSSITILTAIYLFLYAYRLKQEGKFTNNLYSLITAKAIGLLILTPAILLDGRALSAVWAVEATILLFISQKSNNKSHIYFGMIGLGLAFFKFIADIFEVYHTGELDMKQFVIASIVIGAFLYAYRFRWEDKLQKIVDEFSLHLMLVAGAVIMLFVFLNINVINWTKLYAPDAQHISTTLLWIVFGISMFVVSLKKGMEQGKQVAIGLILLAIVKAFFIDLAGADAIYRIVLFMVVGILLFVLAFYYKKREV
jgi:uncharacterized membrane protein